MKNPVTTKGSEPLKCKSSYLMVRCSISCGHWNFLSFENTKDDISKEKKLFADIFYENISKIF